MVSLIPFCSCINFDFIINEVGQIIITKFSEAISISNYSSDKIFRDGVPRITFRALKKESMSILTEFRLLLSMGLI